MGFHELDSSSEKVVGIQVNHLPVIKTLTWLIVQHVDSPLCSLICGFAHIINLAGHQVEAFTVFLQVLCWLP